MNSTMDHELPDNHTRRYVFQPIDLWFNVALYSFLGTLGLYAVITNGLIIFFKHKQRKRNKIATRIRAFSRAHIFTSYIQSLALSDFLCGAISIPLAIATKFIDFLDADYKCKAVRYLNLFFPIATISNLVVIAVERYLTVFHPLKVPPKRALRFIIACAWAFAFLIPILPSSTFEMRRYEIANDSYTLLCWYSSTAFVHKGLVLGILTFIYIVLLAILLILSIRITRYLQQNTNNGRRFRGTSTFIILIFSFVIPYLIPLAYSLVTQVLCVSVSFELDLKIRRLSAAAIYSNSAISPTVMIFTLKDLRMMFKSLFRCRRVKKRHVFHFKSTSFVCHRHFQGFLEPVVLQIPNAPIQSSHTAQRHKSLAKSATFNSENSREKTYMYRRTTMDKRRSKSI